MPHLSQLTIEDVIARAPSVERLNVDWLRSNPPSIYVCAQGFEDRCTAIAASLSTAGIRLKRVIVVSLHSNSEKDQENGRRVVEILGSHSESGPIFIDGGAPGFHTRMASALGGGSSS